MKALVVTVSGLQASYLGCYGNDWIATPNLDALAAAGATFDQHIADRPEPIAARRTWRSGRYHAEGSADAGDLVRALTAEGIPTALIHHSLIDHSTEFAIGWEVVRVVREDAGANAPDTKPLLPTRQALRDVLNFFEDRDSWLVWLDLATLLPPWRLPTDFQGLYLPEADEVENEADAPRLLRDLPAGIPTLSDGLLDSLRFSYADAVTYLDVGLGLIWHHLKKRMLLQDVLVIVTADTGLPLGEHGRIGLTAAGLYEERIHLPLLVRVPGGSAAGRRLDALTQPVDLAPTLLDAFGLPTFGHGQSLLPLLRDEQQSIRPFAFVAAPNGAGADYAVRTPDWSLVIPATAEPELYVKPDDRWEVNNVRQHHFELAERLQQLPRELQEAARRAGPLIFPALHIDP